MAKPTEYLVEIIDLEPSGNRMNKIVKSQTPEHKTKSDTNPKNYTNLILIRSLIVYVMAFISICLRCRKYMNPLYVYIFIDFLDLCENKLNYQLPSPNMYLLASKQYK